MAIVEVCPRVLGGLRQTVVGFFALLLVAMNQTAHASSAADAPVRAKIPVILDTDIGDDIDDTWALGMLLKSPELDLRLALGEYGKAEYRAKLLAKFLQAAGRTDVPVGIGLDAEPKGDGGQAPWVQDYSLDHYPGRVIHDGVQVLVDMVMKSRRRITLIAIGPLTNIAEALAREPRIAPKIDLVGMDGSVRIGYDGTKNVSYEWNIRANIPAAQKVFSAPWHSVTITPLDTCGFVRLDGERYRRLLETKDPIATAVIENYKIWSKHSPDAEKHSSTLFDCLAIYLAISHDLCHMESLNIKVTDDGLTVIDPAGKPMNVATGWRDFDHYLDFLVGRLVGE